MNEWPPGAGARLGFDGGGEADLLPGEEQLHEALQAELIEALASHHRWAGRVVNLSASLAKSGAEVQGYIRSVEASNGRYSCEFIELNEGSGAVLGHEFFALLPPFEEASEASVLILAKAAAVAKDRKATAVPHNVFDELVTSCSAGE
jgi:hypothetical protein